MRAAFLGVIFHIFSDFASGQGLQDLSQEDLDNILIPKTSNSVTVFWEPVDNVSLPSVYDPLEPVNRITFFFNDKLIRYVILPTGEAYRFVVPHVVRGAISRMGSNLASPVRIVNNIAQLKLKSSGTETARFLINSTVGVAGVFDAAKWMGINKPLPEDTGQSFGHWLMRAGSDPYQSQGFYLVLPIMGPSNVRDGVGGVFDLALDGATYLPGGSIFRLNDTFHVVANQYRTSIKNGADPYAELRDLTGHLRAQEILNMGQTVGPNPDWQGDLTLNVLMARLKNPDFLDKAKIRRIKAHGHATRLTYNLWLQKKRAPLVTVIPGLGAHRDHLLPTLLAETMFNHGYSVAVLSSIFSAEYLNSSSAIRFPGLIANDIPQISSDLEAITQDIEDKYPNRVSAKALVGYSMGGLQTLFLADHYKGNRALFDLFLAINPPVDFGHGIDTVDRFGDAAYSWIPEERQSRVVDTFHRALAISQNEKILNPAFHFETSESEYLIGLSFKKILREILSARGHKVSNLLNLKYRDYVTKFVAANNPGYDYQSIVDQSSLLNIEPTLRSSKQIYVIHNQDDFLLSRSSEHFLSQVFRERLIMNPTGGHLGNAGHPDFQAQINSLLDQNLR